MFKSSDHCIWKLFYVALILWIPSSSYAQITTKDIKLVSYGDNILITPKQEWIIEQEKRFAPLKINGSTIPVEVSVRSTTVTNNRHERFVFSTNGVRSVTHTPLGRRVLDDGLPRGRASTLYVTFCGFNGGNLNLDGDGNCEWQTFMNTDMINDSEIPGQEYRYLHYAVNWDSHLVNTNQVSDLAKTIKDFLNSRSDELDVVLIGHSRGGIFAHDLSKKLVGTANIDNLYTYLLDPTAASSISDVYPSKVATKPGQGHHHYAHLLYDRETFIDQYEFNIDLGTDSDRPIPGYTFHYLDADHQDFAGSFLSNTTVGFPSALAEINSHKKTGTFAKDMDTGMYSTRVTKDTGWHGNLHISASVAGGVVVDGNFAIDSNPLLAGHINFVANGNGIELAGGSAVLISSVIINKDVVAVSESNLLSGYSVSLADGEGLDAHVRIAGQSVSVSADTHDVEVTLTVGGTSASTSANTVALIADPITTGVVAVGSSVVKGFKSLF